MFHVPGFIDQTFSTLISLYCRDQTFSTLMSSYCRDQTFSTLISSYCRDATGSSKTWNPESGKGITETETETEYGIRERRFQAID